MINIAAQLVRC